MRYKIRHMTEYEYHERVSICYNKALISPISHHNQQRLFHNIYINPYPESAHFHQDYFGNTTYLFDIYKPHEKMVITAETEVEIKINEVAYEQVSLSYNAAIKAIQENKDKTTLTAREFLYPSIIKHDSAIFFDYAHSVFNSSGSLDQSVKDLTAKIFEDFTYDPEFSSIATPLSHVIKYKRGVCQDFAHLQIACLRALGIPAKYVSGYIETVPPEGQKKLRGVDATHAWIAYYSPTIGWIEYDPTNNKRVDEQYIVTAYGRDYFDVTPIKGVIFGGGNKPKLNVSVDVTRQK